MPKWAWTANKQAAVTSCQLQATRDNPTPTTPTSPTQASLCFETNLMSMQETDIFKSLCVFSS